MDSALVLQMNLTNTLDKELSLCDLSTVFYQLKSEQLTEMWQTQSQYLKLKH